MSRTELEQEGDEATIPFSDSLHFSNDPGSRRLTSSQKKANQWHRWSEDVIPRMVVPYLSYIQETLSLRHANIPGECHVNDGECGTGCRTRSIKVACVLFDVPQPNCLNSLRCCFSNAFHWYRVLTVLARDHISTLITDARKDSSRVDQPNVIVCIDACFTQKCSTNPRSATGSDPPNPTSSFFLPTDGVKAMEDFVQRCRRERHQTRTCRVEPDKDCYEEGMRVPVSVLNGCGDSFIAADEKREKASTRFFTDTGLMALLCRHDRVLWIVNLTSVGEKQHYMLALLDRLFKHIPAQMTIGFLYDIGCQLERSCRKWKFMDNSILSHIAFAVAVFHAYGHQWPCQIVYHPRKQEGFRLSDGEGCEQLWSFLKPLIPSLRVSGKNSTLDSLHDLDVDEHVLRVEWKAQVDHQTKPAPRQSRNKAAEVITTILALEKTLEAQEASIRDLEMQLHGGRVPDI
ncbi:hypothetical protein K503DRAFT_787622, partial [Rhizopogon vinicolor AM-OR11-026]